MMDHVFVKYHLSTAFLPLDIVWDKKAMGHINVRNEVTLDHCVKCGAIRLNASSHNEDYSAVNHVYITGDPTCKVV